MRLRTAAPSLIAFIVSKFMLADSIAFTCSPETPFTKLYKGLEKLIITNLRLEGKPPTRELVQF